MCPCHSVGLPPLPYSNFHQPAHGSRPCCRQDCLGTTSKLCSAIVSGGSWVDNAAHRQENCQQQWGQDALTVPNVIQKSPNADLAVMTVEATSAQASRNTSSTGPRWSSYRTFCRRRICSAQHAACHRLSTPFLMHGARLSCCHCSILYQVSRAAAAPQLDARAATSLRIVIRQPCHCIKRCTWMVRFLYIKSAYRMKTNATGAISMPAICRARVRSFHSSKQAGSAVRPSLEIIVAWCIVPLAASKYRCGCSRRRTCEAWVLPTMPVAPPVSVAPPSRDSACRSQQCE
jgi:hypothetical protein